MQPDGNGGGPVVIPQVYNGRNKTFWYSGYQKLIEKKAARPIPARRRRRPNWRAISPSAGWGSHCTIRATTRQLPDGTWTRDPIPGQRRFR